MMIFKKSLSREIREATTLAELLLLTKKVRPGRRERDLMVQIMERSSPLIADLDELEKVINAVSLTEVKNLLIVGYVGSKTVNTLEGFRRLQSMIVPGPASAEACEALNTALAPLLVWEEDTTLLDLCEYAEQLYGNDDDVAEIAAHAEDTIIAAALPLMNDISDVERMATAFSAAIGRHKTIIAYAEKAKTILIADADALMNLVQCLEEKGREAICAIFGAVKTELLFTEKADLEDLTRMASLIVTDAIRPCSPEEEMLQAQDRIFDAILEKVSSPEAIISMSRNLRTAYDRNRLLMDYIKKYGVSCNEDVDALANAISGQDDLGIETRVALVIAAQTANLEINVREIVTPRRRTIDLGLQIAISKFVKSRSGGHLSINFGTEDGAGTKPLFGGVKGEPEGPDTIKGFCDEPLFGPYGFEGRFFEGAFGGPSKTRPRPNSEFNIARMMGRHRVAMTDGPTLPGIDIARFLPGAGGGLGFNTLFVHRADCGRCPEKDFCPNKHID